MVGSYRGSVCLRARSFGVYRVFCVPGIKSEDASTPTFDKLHGRMENMRESLKSSE